MQFVPKIDIGINLAEESVTKGFFFLIFLEEIKIKKKNSICFVKNGIR